MFTRANSSSSLHKCQFSNYCRYHKRVSNIIDDVLEWSPTLALSGMMEKQQTVVNATEPDSNFAGQSKNNPEGEAPTDETGAGSVPENHEAEVPENTQDTDQHKRHDNI